MQQPKPTKTVTFGRDFRRSFVRGLATALPTVLTVAIIIYVFKFVQGNIGEPINTAIIYVLDPLIESKDSKQLTQLWADSWYLRGVGFVAAVVGVYLVGRLVASFVGKSVWGMVERALTRTPLIKLIYPNIKQVTDFLLKEERVEFSRVVAVEYPRKGIWSMGLVTGAGLSPLRARLGADVLTIFIPSSPTPVTGYTIMVRREDVVDLPLTIDEAMRFTVSGGVLAPTFRRPLADTDDSAGARPAAELTSGKAAPIGDEPTTPQVQQEKDS